MVKVGRRRSFKYLRISEIFIALIIVNIDAGVFLQLPISCAVILLLATVRIINGSDRFETILGFLLGFAVA